MRVRALSVCLATATALLAAGTGTPATADDGFTFSTYPLTGGAYGEPSIAIAPDGQHVAVSTPGGGGVNVWYSGNDGGSFAYKKTTSSGGGGDSELDFLPDGTLLSADLTIQNSNVKLSTDFGANWGQAASVGVEQDRQWFAHSPDGRTTYLVYHDFALEAEMYAKGTYDPATKTVTWPQADAAHAVTPPHGAPGPALTPVSGPSAIDQGVNTFSGPMLVDSNGLDLYVAYSISDAQCNVSPTCGLPPYGAPRGIVIAHSADGGTVWNTSYAVQNPLAPGDPAAEETNTAFFPWGFLDAAGNVYVVYNSTRGATAGHFHQYYVYSTDKGTTWSTPIKLDTLSTNTGAAVYATGAGGAAGVIDVAWYQSDTDTPDNISLWTPHFAQVRNAASATPVISTDVIGPPNHNGGICLQGLLCGTAPGSPDRSLLDFFELAINPVTCMAEIAYSNNYLGNKVVYAKQVDGPSACATADPVVPEAPTSVLLPLAAATMVGAAVFVRRRRLVRG